MIEYPKIETIYERDTDGSKQLIPGRYRSNTVEFLKDNQWFFTEKIDGTNISVCWDGHSVEFHGRTERADIPAPLMTKLTEMFGSDEAEELFEQMFGDKPVILYGEGYGAKIQGRGGAYIPDDVSFILFDVFCCDNWQPRERVVDIALTFGIDFVPVVLTGTLDEGIAYVKSHPKSTIGTADMEGVVARPAVEMRDRCGHRVIVKIKYKDFKEMGV
jgi:hypothetical protein